MGALVSQNGKGSSPRPVANRADFRRRWDATFGRIDRAYRRMREGKGDRAIVREEGPGHRTIEIVKAEDEE